MARSNREIQKEISKGLISPEIRLNDDIPFADEVELEDVSAEDEPLRPSRNKESRAANGPGYRPRIIHAADLGLVHKSPENDTIVVNTPEGTLYITLEPEGKTKTTATFTDISPQPSTSKALHSPPSALKALPSPPGTSKSHSAPPSPSTALPSPPSTSKAYGAQDSDNLITNEKDDVEQPKSTLTRRNSISMPTLQNLELEVMKQQYLNNPQDQIPEHHQSTASGFSDADTNADDVHEVLSDDDRVKVPLRSPRRKGPRRLARSEFSMDEDDYSPSNSVTSVNSLASLLREKLQSIPQKIRKKPINYKLYAFVILMFVALALFIGFAYELYHAQALTKAYFTNVQFNEPHRQIRIYNREDVEILRASLAVNLKGKAKAFPCLPEHQHSDGSKCLEYVGKLRYYLKVLPQDPSGDNTTCYSMHWKSLRQDISPKDCFDWYDTKVHWYGLGQSYNLTWPLDTGYVDYTPFITGDTQRSQWSNVLTRYLINSKGAAVIIDEETPLHVSVNEDGKAICIKAEYDEFAYANKLTDFAEMKYNICTSVDMRALHSSIHSHRQAPLWDGLKPADMKTLESLLTEPVWHLAPRFKHELQAETIANYTEDVTNHGFKPGHVLLNEFWQNEIGDLTVDQSRFETLKETINKLHRRGFKVALTVQPFISTQSTNFAECVQRRLLISERNSDRRIPALARFKSLASSGVIDVTNNRSVPWFLDKLQSVIDDYNIDAFYFDLGTAYDMPHYYRCEKLLVNPDQYKNFFTKTFENTLNVIGVSSAISLPRPPIFVSLPPFESTWEALKRVIPTILTYGVNGYPFIMPGAVGGDIYWPEYNYTYYDYNFTSYELNSTEEINTDLPSRELYVRWLQMATFLPVMKFKHFPGEYDEKVLDMAKNLTQFRQKTVAPLLMKYKREALEEGMPLIRPLWLVAASDAALLVQDEFAIGDEIVVAPVLNPGQTKREVYLPAGLWQDGIDGSLRKGNRWMHEYKVPLDKVAYFLRKPDDLRF